MVPTLTAYQIRSGGGGHVAAEVVSCKDATIGIAETSLEGVEIRSTTAEFRHYQLRRRADLECRTKVFRLCCRLTLVSESLRALRGANLSTSKSAHW